MMGTMTDAELIELVQTKTPPELTEAEVAALGERMKQSPTLRQVLAEHLEMDRYLADALGHVRISPEQVLARANQGAVQLQRSVRRWAALSLVLSGALVVGLTWWFLGTKGEGKGIEDAPEGRAVAAMTPHSTQRRSPGTGAASGSGRSPETNPKPNTSPPDEPQPVAVEPPRNTASEPYALADLSEPGLNEAQMKAWFAPVEGQRHALKVLPAQRQRIPFLAEATEMNGIWRLRTPWQAGSVLRCLFRTVNSFKFHVWNGTDGVTLELWRGAARHPSLPDLSLVAYRTTRKGKEPLPATMVLAASDEGEFWRTRTQFVPSGYSRLVSTPFDLRHEDGLLTVSFGDVRILSIPFAAAPAEVFFEGEVSIQSIGIAPLLALPPLPEPLPTVLDVENPATLKWLLHQANLQTLTDGSVELAAEKAKDRVAVATILPPQGICEAIVQLEDVMPGTGVYLGDEKGQIRYAVSFLLDEATGRLFVQESNATDTAASVRTAPVSKWPPAFVADKVWLRLLMACGQLKCWVSDDGVHWGRAFESPTGRPAEPCTSLGLFCQPGGGRHSIRLRRLMLRELRALNSLAPADLVRQAPLMPHTLYTPLNDWLLGAHSARPPNVDAATWSRACAIRALACGVSPAQGIIMLENLLDHGLAQPLPFEARRRLIDEALMLVPKSTTLVEQRFPRYYERLGQALHAAGEARPFSRLRQAVYHMPLWSSHVVDGFPESLALSEMLDLAGAGNWDEAEMVAHFGQIHRSSPSVFEWAETLTGRRRISKVKKAPGRKGLPSSWQPALILEQDKEATTDLGEIEAALRANSFREAGRILTRFKRRGDRILVPDSGDSND